jgi:hypothetical protein
VARGVWFTGNAPLGGEVIYLNTSLSFRDSVGAVGDEGYFIDDTVFFFTGEGILGPTQSIIASYLRAKQI